MMSRMGNTCKNKPLTLGLIVGLALVLVACNNEGKQHNVNRASVAAGEMEGTNTGEVSNRMDTQEQIAFSKEDLAKRHSIEVDAVTVADSMPVTWRSGALGCPQPDMNYTQALVPGVLITLKVDNTTYNYHARTGGQPRHCPAGQAESPADSQGRAND